MKEVLKKIVTMFLVMMLLINSSAMLIISEAVDEIQILTNNKNVQFIAYFEDDSGNKVSKISKELNMDDMKLYLELSVEKEGYLENANITLKNSNFVFDTQNQIDGISQISEDSLKVDYIGAGEIKKFEIKVQAKKNESYNLDLLEQETQIELKANYVNSQSNNTEITTTRKVQWKQTSPYNDENNGAEVNQKVITNTNAIYDGQEKRILQLEVENKLNGNEYPVKNTKLELAIPRVNGENPEKVIVNSIQRGLTTTKELTEEDYSYDEEKIIINSANEVTEENTVEWKQDGEDKYIVTYIFNKVDNIEEQELNAKIELNLYDSKNTKITAENSIELDQEEKNSIISTEILNAEDEIYKGKLYEEKQRKITENVKINVNCLKVMANIELQEESNKNLETKQISINKNNMLEILGEEGIIEVLDSNTENKIAEINKDTEEDENGDIEIKTNDVDAIKIKTSEPQKVGTINIKAIKILKEEQENKIKQMQEISYAIVGKNINKVETKIKLNETQTDAVLEINKDSLNTMQENEIEAKVILKENSEANELYKNPTIEIELPEQVEQAEITNINKMYADNFNISKYDIEEKNGRKIIRVKLVGEDTKYVENIICGPTVVLNLKLTLNKLAKTSTEKIKMNYTNEKAKGYKDNAQTGTEEKEIQITSPTGIITTNKIKELNVNTIGEEENKNVKIEVGQEEKQATVEKEVINNTGEKVENVVISGRFATDGKDNNMGVVLASAVGVSGIENAKVYYTEKEYATEDLNDSNNEWTTEASTNAKNYMVAIDKMETTDVANITYKEKIPSSLEYNKNAVETYAITYDENSNGTSQQVNGTNVNLTTGTGPDLNVTLTAQVGGDDIANGDEVKQGEVIKYIVKVTNNGTEEAENVTVKGLVPDGTVYLGIVDDYVYNYDQYYNEEPNKKEYDERISKIGVGETKEISYEVRVKNENDVVGNSGTNKITINYNDIVKESNEMKVKYALGKIRVTVKCVLDLSVNINQYNNVKYQIILENMTNEKIENLEISEEHAEYMELGKIWQDNDIEGKYKDNIENKNGKYYVKNLQAGEKIILGAIYSCNKIKEENLSRVKYMITDGNTQYKSNVFYRKANPSKYVEVTQTSKTEGEYVKTGDSIEYVLNITGYNIDNEDEISISDSLPGELTLEKVYVGNEEITDYTYGNDKQLTFKTSIKKGENEPVKIVAKVNYQEDLTNDIEILHKFDLSFGVDFYHTNTIKNILQKNKQTDPVTPDNPDNPDNPNNPDTPDNPDSPDEPNNPTTEKYTITGIAWNDENENGIKDEDEKSLQNIPVYLYNVKTNKLVSNTNLNTDETGKYQIDNVEKGEYLVLFDYDTSKYKLTTYKANWVQESKNSDVVVGKITINGEEKSYAVSDKITITDRSMANINIGLIELKTVDVKIQKSIKRVITQDSTNTTAYEYNAENLAKVELNAKKVAGTTVIVEYEIKVTNVGEVDTYIRKIKDYMPQDMVFKSELNKDWYINGKDLYSSSLANKKLKAGETATINLTLTKGMTASNVGLINNKAEISEIYTEDELKENNIENNVDNAQLIVSIKTGTFIMYSVIAVLVLAFVLICIVYIIRKKN